jgi:hypothetical protein
MRISYEAGGLLEEDLAPGPLEQFDAWFKAAVERKVGRWIERGGRRLESTHRHRAWVSRK